MHQNAQLQNLRVGLVWRWELVAAIRYVLPIPNDRMTGAMIATGTTRFTVLRGANSRIQTIS